MSVSPQCLGPRLGCVERTGSSLGSGCFWIRKGAKPLKDLGSANKHVL